MKEKLHSAMVNLLIESPNVVVSSTLEIILLQLEGKT